MKEKDDSLFNISMGAAIGGLISAAIIGAVAYWYYQTYKTQIMSSATSALSSSAAGGITSVLSSLTGS